MHEQPQVPDRTGPGLLVAVLAELGWRPEWLAAEVNERAALRGIRARAHPKTPYKWARGIRPRRPWPGLVAAALSAHRTTPVTAVDLGWDDEPPVPALEGLDVPWTAAGGLRAARVLAEGEHMQRRGFLALLGTTVTVPAHEWLIAHAAGDVSRATGTDLPAGVVDVLDRITAGLRRMDDQLGSANLSTLVGTHLRTVVDLISTRRYDDTLGRRLHAAAAELLRLGGFLAFDSGHHALAPRHWVAALHTARTAGDRALAANVLGFMSCQAKDLGQAREAVTLAETARTDHRLASPQVRAILDLRAAEAHAVAGNPHTTRHNIDTAFEHLTAIGSVPAGTGPQTPEWSSWMDTTHAHGQPGTATCASGSGTRPAPTYEPPCTQATRPAPPPAKEPSARPCWPPPGSANPTPTSTRLSTSPAGPWTPSPDRSPPPASSATSPP